MNSETLIERRVQIGHSWSGRLGGFIIESYASGRTVARSLTEDEAREMRRCQRCTTKLSVKIMSVIAE